MTEFRFSTIFDRPVVRLPPDGQLSHGTDPSLGMVDGFVRGHRIVGRFSEPRAALALRVEPTRDPLQMSIQFHYDLGSTQWWRDRVAEDVWPRRPRGPRLLMVRVNGSVMQGVLLDLEGKDGSGRLRQHSLGWASLELEAYKVPPDGFVLIEVEDGSEHAPEWARDRLAPHGPVGIRIDVIRLAGGPAPTLPARLSPLHDELSARVSTGGIRSKAETSPRVARCGLLVVNAEPDGSSALTTRELRPRVVQRSVASNVPRRRIRPVDVDEPKMPVRVFEHVAAMADGLDVTSERFPRRVVKASRIEQTPAEAPAPPAAQRRSQSLSQRGRRSLARVARLMPARVRIGANSRLARLLVASAELTVRAASLTDGRLVAAHLEYDARRRLMLSVAHADAPVLVDVQLERAVGRRVRFAVGGRSSTAPPSEGTHTSATRATG